MTMPSDRSMEQDQRLLKPEAFDFVLSNELKRAARSQNYLTLILLEPSVSGMPGAGKEERDAAVRDVAALLSRDVRETDLLAHTGEGQLSVVLLDSDMPSSLQVI
ncbi:MAG: hypothetical protein ABIP65_03010, partial [Vicinamibacterales bacterium]